MKKRKKITIAGTINTVLLGLITFICVISVMVYFLLIRYLHQEQ